jgi:hypothetical protein
MGAAMTYLKETSCPLLAEHDRISKNVMNYEPKGIRNLGRPVKEKDSVFYNAYTRQSWLWWWS